MSNSGPDAETHGAMAARLEPTSPRGCQGSGVPASWGVRSLRDPQPPRAGPERGSAARGLARVPLGQGSPLSTYLPIYSNNVFLGCAEWLLGPNVQTTRETPPFIHLCIFEKYLTTLRERLRCRTQWLGLHTRWNDRNNFG